ncbi:hypothetical protein SLEP1_g55532 [Rubroshorea leprosula]|uniref:Uncharacterized protein n=1 Tax=Rubroshorea leprosula TaxID=152421 RepID=A0AAV5MGS4_9ROSI|nr:hypothetical protein SLEP1_g55532 [Rubroshorea leprosula]
MARCNATLMAVFLALFALFGLALAADAPAPTPTAGAGSFSPSFVSAVFAVVVALLLGSSFRI